jgi:hypothetical protein
MHNGEQQTSRAYQDVALLALIFLPESTQRFSAPLTL